LPAEISPYGRKSLRKTTCGRLGEDLAWGFSIRAPSTPFHNYCVVVSVGPAIKRGRRPATYRSYRNSSHDGGFPDHVSVMVEAHVRAPLPSPIRPHRRCITEGTKTSTKLPGLLPPRPLPLLSWQQRPLSWPPGPLLSLPRPLPGAPDPCTGI
jgi:hypothetical protein